MSNKIQDVIIIGAGPSALTAAVYTSRDGMSTVLYEKGAVGGTVATIDKIDNYPGFYEGIEGYVLAENLEKQAKRFGAKIEFGDVTAIRDDGKVKIAVIDGQDVKAKTILIATGGSCRKLGIPGEQEYLSRGVHYCATCDGAFYHNKRLVVVGGGNSAVQEAIFLTRFASHVDLVSISGLTASAILQRDLQGFVDKGKITIHLNTSTDEIVATDGRVTSIRTTKAGKSTIIETDGVFIFIGHKPNTDFLTGSGIELDKFGFIKTDAKLQTNISGIFASGDVRNGSTKQIASATGEGTTAAISIREYLNHGK
jgi:thioredoxin reductase (NADPH)